MILILTDLNEPTTDLVIDWLNFYKKKFIRISNNYPVKILKIHFFNGKLEAILEYKNIIIDTTSITSYWYRRSNLTIKVNAILEQEMNIINDHLILENKAALSIIYQILNHKKRINKFDDAIDVCKINNLQIALNNGLKVPDSIICTSKSLLIDFYNKHNRKIITKDIGDPTFLFLKGYNAYTNKIDFNKMPENFGISLFQELIEKKFEIRIFVLNNTFYSSAIFSQSNKKTKIDFKKYDSKNPNRVVPFKLPKEIERKLSNFMKECNLNSGSIDLIFSKKNEYVFLEVNPVGQFEQVSFPCNYNIFQQIALYL